jgi:hypothetical protein
VQQDRRIGIPHHPTCIQAAVPIAARRPGRNGNIAMDARLHDASFLASCTGLESHARKARLKPAIVKSPRRGQGGVPGGVGAYHSPLMFAALMMGHHFSISAF